MQSTVFSQTIALGGNGRFIYMLDFPSFHIAIDTRIIGVTGSKYLGIFYVPVEASTKQFLIRGSKYTGIISGDGISQMFLIRKSSFYRIIEIYENSQTFSSIDTPILSEAPVADMNIAVISNQNLVPNMNMVSIGGVIQYFKIIENTPIGMIDAKVGKVMDGHYEIIDGQTAVMDGMIEVQQSTGVKTQSIRDHGLYYERGDLEFPYMVGGSIMITNFGNNVLGATASFMLSIDAFGDDYIPALLQTYGTIVGTMTVDISAIISDKNIFTIR